MARWLKRRRPAAFLVQLMWPGSARGLDLVAVPAHDERAEQAAADASRARRIGSRRRGWPRPPSALAPRLQGLPRPYIACLVGGSNRRTRFTRDDALELARQASRLAREQGGSLLVTTSRRTGAACAAALARAIAAPRLLHRFAPGGDNPYLGLLGAADAIIVTADFGLDVRRGLRAAASPCSCSGRRRAPRPSSPACIAGSSRPGHLRPLGAPWPTRCPPPLNPAASVAAAIRARLLGPIGAAPGRRWHRRRRPLKFTAQRG